MSDVGVESLVSLWVERGTIEFPQSSDVPVIMVGPGTGCAPFRSFIQDRISQSIAGRLSMLSFSASLSCTGTAASVLCIQ